MRARERMKRKKAKRNEQRRGRGEEGVEFLESSFDLTPKPTQRTLPLLDGLSSLDLDFTPHFPVLTKPVDLSSSRFVILSHSLPSSPSSLDQLGLRLILRLLMLVSPRCFCLLSTFTEVGLLGFQSGWSLGYDLCCNRVQLSLSFLRDVSSLLVLLL